VARKNSDKKIIFQLIIDRHWLGKKPETEYQFLSKDRANALCVEPRRWRFDFAWPDWKLAVEIEGGVFAHGRHTRGKGYEADCEKYNAAAVLGWTVLRYTPDMLQKNPLLAIEQCKKIIQKKTQWTLRKTNNCK